MQRVCQHCLSKYTTNHSKRKWCYNCMPMSRPFNARDRYLLETYNMTKIEYADMYLQQEGKCKIQVCDREATHIDHDHKCCPGRKSCGACVRGLLCDPCNRDLGMLENALWRNSALNYLEQTKGGG